MLDHAGGSGLDVEIILLAARAPAVMSRGMMRSRGVVFMVKKVFLTY